MFLSLSKALVGRHGPAPETLQERLQFIEIYTKKRIQAHLLGEYESRRKGIGFEFMEHRRYLPGDDYRRIDWNVTARSRHPFVKRYVADKEVQVWLLADLSSSMFFGSGRLSKARLVKEVVATLGFSASSLNMKVGFLGFSDRVEALIPPRQSRQVTREILALIPEVRRRRHGTHLGEAMRVLRSRLKATSLIFIISDFISLEAVAGEVPVKYLARHHDLVPVVTEDQLERTIPAVSGMHCLEDPESGRRRMTYWSREKVRQYQEQMKQRREGLTALFWGMNLDFLWIDPDDPAYVDRLLEFFIQRRRGS